MARTTKQLTATEVKSAKTKKKDYKLFDGGGLFLLVTKGGGRHWKLKYRIDGKERKVSLGAYPIVGLSEARLLAAKQKKLIFSGVDPNEKMKQEKQAKEQEQKKKSNTFYSVSQKWLKSYRDQVSENYHIRLGRALDNYLYPTLRDMPIEEISRLDIIAVLESLRDRGIQETARRTATLLNKIYKYATTHELTKHNIIADIDMPTVLGRKVEKHYPTIKDKTILKGLLNAIDEYSGDYFVKMALRVLPYVFVRSYNIRHMEWVEIDFKAKEWIIPAHKMKTKEEFTLPLPHQVITLLEELKEHSTSRVYVFPSFRSDGKPMSDNTMISALRRMGYSKEELVPHSFRSIFSTIANEYRNLEGGHPYSREVIEACLAHKEPSKVIGAYNHAEYKEPMRGLMQWYADHLEEIKCK